MKEKEEMNIWVEFCRFLELQQELIKSKQELCRTHQEVFKSEQIRQHMYDDENIVEIFITNKNIGSGKFLNKLLGYQEKVFLKLSGVDISTDS